MTLNVLFCFGLDFGVFWLKPLVDQVLRKV